MALRGLDLEQLLGRFTLQPAMRILITRMAAGLCVLWASGAAAQPTRDAVEANHRAIFPGGDGPFPTVVAIPGCSGVSLDGRATDEGRPGDQADRLFRRHYWRMATRLAEAGYGVVLVDYLGAEGVANACSGEITHMRVGEYIAGALEFARSMPQVDSTRLFVVGWSHGGAGVLAWLEDLGDRSTPAVGAVAIYPGCRGRGAWASAVPVLVVLGEADDITPAATCDAVLQQLPDGVPIEVRRYAGARHGFDFSEGPEVMSIGGGMTVGRNRAAGEKAWEAIFEFLRTHRSE